MAEHEREQYQRTHELEEEQSIGNTLADMQAYATDVLRNIVSLEFRGGGTREVSQPLRTGRKGIEGQSK